jgi:hypothetical protein
MTSQSADVVDRINKQVCSGRIRLSDAEGVARVVANWALEQPTITLSATDALTLAMAVLRKER